MRKTFTLGKTAGARRCGEKKIAVPTRKEPKVRVAGKGREI